MLVELAAWVKWSDKFGGGLQMIFLPRWIVLGIDSIMLGSKRTRKETGVLLCRRLRVSVGIVY